MMQMTANRLDVYNIW